MPAARVVTVDGDEGERFLLIEGPGGAAVTEHEVTLTSGVTFLSITLAHEKPDGYEPARGVILTVQAPDGTIYRSDAPPRGRPAADGTVSSIIYRTTEAGFSFFDPYPAAGMWRIQVAAMEESPSYAVRLFGYTQLSPTNVTSAEPESSASFEHFMRDVLAATNADALMPSVDSMDDCTWCQAKVLLVLTVTGLIIAVVGLGVAALGWWFPPLMAFGAQLAVFGLFVALAALADTIRAAISRFGPEPGSVAYLTCQAANRCGPMQAPMTG